MDEGKVSGAHALIGYEVDLSASDGSARVLLDLAPKHLNRNDSLHGGIVAMLLDSATGFAASRYFGNEVLQPVVTVSLTTNFVAAARSGQVVATARITGGGRKIAYAWGELHDQDGLLIATASGVFKRLG